MDPSTRNRRSHRGPGPGAAPAAAPTPIERPAPMPNELRPTYPDRGGRFEIRTPVRDFKGVRHNVQFFEGIGHTDDPVRAAACGELGYQVIDTHAPAAAGANEKGNG